MKHTCWPLVQNALARSTGQPQLPARAGTPISYAALSAATPALPELSSSSNAGRLLERLAAWREMAVFERALRLFLAGNPAEEGGDADLLANKPHADARQVRWASRGPPRDSLNLPALAAASHPGSDVPCRSLCTQEWRFPISGGHMRKWWA